VAPENTLLGFEKGLSDGAHILESDIHVTRDGVPVLIHDPELDRTTNGRGRVEAVDWSELRGLDAGCRFQANAEGGASFAGQGLAVPRLRDAFEAFPAVAFNLEIKSSARDLVPSVVALVREFEREDRTLLVAGEDAIQARLRRELADTGIRPALGASLADIVGIALAAREGKPHESDSMAIQVPLDFGSNRLVTSALIAHCRAHGVQVHVWTINAPDTMRELLDQGVDGIITDLPGVMADVIAKAP
jgi:glycerophosphoryl diester phosphodiesterase